VIDIELRGADAFQASLSTMVAQVEEHVSTEFAKWTMRIFTDLALSTPQWSGDTAANWNYSVQIPDGTYRPIVGKAVMWPWNPAFPPRQRGAWAAVWTALDRAKEVTPPRYDQKVYFTNNTPIAPRLEAESVYVRPINLIGEHVAMAHYIAAKWSRMPA
jgi:hypothetical protein